MRFFRHNSGVRWWENRPLATSVDRGRLEKMHHRGTVNRVIPWWVARQQSPPLFHPAGGLDRNSNRETREVGEKIEEQKCPDKEGGMEYSEETLVFCPNKGVHLNDSVSTHTVVSAAAQQGISALTKLQGMWKKRCRFWF